MAAAQAAAIVVGMKLTVLCCVGLTPGHIGPATPTLAHLAQRGFLAPLTTALPAVTTTAQTTMLTGVDPSQHGIVANGWYFRDQGEIWLWRQSEGLVQAPHAWQGLTGDGGRPLRVLKHFWWYAMNSCADAVVTPRPGYHADGRKSPDIYTQPPALRELLQTRHGAFPLFQFWGPAAGLPSSRWIADSFVSALEQSAADLALCYLPHLDYDLQRHGPSGPHLERNLRALDACAATVIGAAQAAGHRMLVVSEYGISPVCNAAAPNQALRRAGLAAVTVNGTGTLLDPSASRAFAVCDHQLAHIYCRDDDAMRAARSALEGLPGIGELRHGAERRTWGLDHPRSGELIAMAADGWWFAHDYWLDGEALPDFARCVEIHRKPGYDPRELLFDPQGGRWRAARALLRKKLGLRYVMDPVPLDAGLVRGSHGRPAARPADGAVLIADDAGLRRDEPWHQRDIADLMRRILRA